MNRVTIEWIKGVSFLLDIHTTTALFGCGNRGNFLLELFFFRSFLTFFLSFARSLDRFLPDVSLSFSVSLSLEKEWWVHFSSCVKHNTTPKTKATHTHTKVTMKLSLISIVCTLILLLTHGNNAFQSSSSFSRPYAPHSSFSESILTTTQRKSLSLPSWNRRQKSSTTTTTTTQLEVSPLTAVTSSPLGAISVLAGIVVVHEAGHYLAARSFNIAVEEFSIGFGPKLIGFEALGNEFNLRALPLGGFVRFPENYDIELAEQKSREAVKAFEKRREEEEWTAKENFLYTITFGQWDERRRQERKALRVEQAQEEWKKRPWWQKLGKKQTNTLLDNDPEDYEIQYYDDPNLLQNRPWTERAIVLSMGVIFNLILSFLIYFGQIGPLGKGLPQPIFDSGVMVSQVPTRNGPSDGMLNKGDVIVGINGNIVSMAKDSGVVGAQKQVSNVISTIRETKDGESVTLKVIREGKSTPENLEITPKRNGQASPQGTKSIFHLYIYV